MDNAKEKDLDFVQECSCKFEPLLMCQTENREYFEEVMRMGDSEDDEEGEDSEGKPETEQGVEDKDAPADHLASEPSDSNITKS